MFCPQCGTLNEDTSKFCGGCGNRLLAEEPVVPVAEAVIEEPAEEIAVAAEETVAEAVVAAEETVAEAVVAVEESAPVAEPVAAGEEMPEDPVQPVRPVYRPPVQKEKAKDPGRMLGVVSLVLGGLSLVGCCFSALALVVAVAAVVLACVGIIKSRRCGYVNGFAIAGLVCGGVGILVGAIALAITLCFSAGVFAGMMGTDPNMYYYY